MYGDNIVYSALTYTTTPLDIRRAELFNKKNTLIVDNIML